MMKDILTQLPLIFTSYNMLFLGEAMLTTLLLSAVGCLIGTVFGTALALVRLSQSRVALAPKFLAIGYIEVFRRVPFLVSLLLFFFGSQVLGFDLSPLSVAVLTTSVISSAYIAEIVRSGLGAINKNQIEAAEVMNFSHWQMLRLVRWPQAWPLILPPVFSYFVMFIKDTALASQIGVLELTQAAKIFNTKGYLALLSFGVILILYFVISYPLAQLGLYLESRLGTSRHQRSRRPLR